VENQALIWNALSELETNFAELGGSRKYQGFEHIEIPYYICAYLLIKIYFEDQPKLIVNSQFLNHSITVIDRVHSLLDRINLDDLQLINLVDQLINNINSNNKDNGKNYSWKELELFVQNLQSLDHGIEARMILHQIKLNGLINSRACLKPQIWSEFSEFVETKIEFPPNQKFPLSFILASWKETTDQEKFDRFYEQLKVIADEGYIRQIKVVLDSYSEDVWHHFGDN